MKVLVVAGTHSGVGKTTISTALMLAYARRGVKVRAYKVGADFVDPMAHRAALREGRGESENLDGYLMSETRATTTAARPPASAATRFEDDSSGGASANL